MWVKSIPIFSLAVVANDFYPLRVSRFRFIRIKFKFRFFVYQHVVRMARQSSPEIYGDDWVGDNFVRAQKHMFSVSCSVERISNFFQVSCLLLFRIN